ncbi:hypothetical protein [Rhizobium lentis]|uniref:Uncharacterized protein n=1 Tax=Rhizobium lentis TaxID=1138194 RepID=A0A9Q3QVJ1_9HYPH|nr:hypothetical protein [Rhizobium lentis]MBX4954383.1 hypothetical protein [Rhizobium lentis]MBX4984391.1 hypothetical protein [Rhizobium lentis]MBX4996619.1 hypothetical protein [Rhizobium lentis]MBX5002630.1 hypothetical protein [Rhizobium lentis]MBX5009124.1 hypothetical protein [Rhizobium lentis]
MDIDLDRPEAIRSRVKRIVAGDFDYSHFATIIMWLRERVPKNSTLRELGDFLAHPCRERGPTSAAVNDLLMDVWDKLEGLDAKKLGGELAERAVKVEEIYFEFREALLDAGLLLAEEDDSLAPAYEAFVLFTLSSLHECALITNGWDVVLRVAITNNGNLAIFGHTFLNKNGRAFRTNFLIFSTTLAAADWLIATVAAGFVREPLMYAAAPKLISFEG